MDKETNLQKWARERRSGGYVHPETRKNIRGEEKKILNDLDQDQKTHVKVPSGVWPDDKYHTKANQEEPKKWKLTLSSILLFLALLFFGFSVYLLSKQDP